MCPSILAGLSGFANIQVLTVSGDSMLDSFLLCCNMRRLHLASLKVLICGDPPSDWSALLEFIRTHSPLTSGSLERVGWLAPPSNLLRRLIRESFTAKIPNSEDITILNQRFV